MESSRDKSDSENDEPVEYSNTSRKVKYDENLIQQQNASNSVKKTKPKKKRSKLPLDVIQSALTAEPSFSSIPKNNISCQNNIRVKSHIKFEEDDEITEEKGRSSKSTTLKKVSKAKITNSKSSKCSVEDFIRKNLYGDKITRTNPINNLRRRRFAPI